MGEADHIVLQRWRARQDAEAFRELVDRYSSMVYATCRRVLGNASEAEDAAQECFEALAQARSVPEAYFGPWLHQLAVRQSLNRRRGELRRRQREEAYAAARPELTRPEWDDVYQFVDEAIAALPEQHRAPIIAHFLEGRTHQDIAETLAVSRQTVAYRIDRGIEQVRKSLRRRGVEIAGSALAGMLAANTAEAAPATLLATLGKISVAGITRSGAGTTSTLATLGGTFLVKKAIVGIGALLLLSAGALLYPALKSELSGVVKSEPVYEQIDTSQQSDGPVISQAATPESENPALPVMAELADTGSISGRLFAAASGKAIPNGVVAAYIPPPQEKPNHVMCDTTGAYRIDGLKPGRYVVFPWIKALPLWQMEDPRLKLEVLVRAGQNATGVDLAVDMGAQIMGTVVDEDGRPVKDAEVLKHLLAADGSEKPDAREGSHARVFTEEDGQFYLAGFGPGDTVCISAILRDERAQALGSVLSDPIPLGENDEVEITLVLQTGSTVAGRVQFPDGRPVEGANLHLHRNEPGLQGRLPYAPGTSAADGTFSITHIPPGEYGLIILPPGERSYVEALPPWNMLRVEQGKDIQDVVAVLDLKLSISGTVTDLNGQPLPKVEIGCISGRYFRSATTNDRGEYRVYDLVAGAYRVNVLFLNGKPVDANTIPGAVIEDVPAGSTGIDLQIEAFGTATLAGRVVDDQDGKPLPKFKLLVLDGGQRYQPGYGDFREYEHEQGAFEVTNLAPGPITLVARQEGYSDSELSLADFPESEPQPEIVIRMRKGASIRGLVQDQQGEPIAGARIFAGRIPVMEIELPEGMAVARTNADGTFQANDLPAEIATMSALAKGFAAGEAALLPPAQRKEFDIVIVLSRGGTIEGHVYTDGEPWSGQRVTLGVPRLDGEHQVLTDAGGAYRFEGVQTGSVLLIADTVADPKDLAAGHRQIMRTIEVAENAVTRADFDFTQTAQTLEGVVGKEGAPQPNVSVVLAMETSAGMQQSTTSTDAEGLYSFNVGEGLATVSAESEGGRTTRTVEISGEDQEPVRLDLDLASGAALTGQVTGLEAGRNAAVFVFEGDVEIGPMTVEEFRDNLLITLRPQLRGNGQVRADGSFELPGLEPGTYTVLVIESHEPESGLPGQGLATVELTEDSTESLEIALQ